VVVAAAVAAVADCKIGVGHKFESDIAIVLKMSLLYIFLTCVAKCRTLCR
jgi:hypothetical protein